MAEELARRGAAVAIAHHGAPELAAAVADRIGAAGGRAIEVDADLSIVDDNRRLVQRVVDELGRLDIFVANAGLTRWAPFLDVDEATWDTVVDLNLKGSYFGAQAAARQMIEQGNGGRIVFSSSVTGTLAIANASAYAVTKAGLQHMARVLALELGAHGDHGERARHRGHGQRAEPRRRPRVRGALGRRPSQRPGRDDRATSLPRSDSSSPRRQRRSPATR